MREFLFRGKTYDGQWIYGNLLVKGSFCYIIGTDDSKAVEVIPDSVGQYTGLKDCKGNKIFDGDIILFHNSIQQVVEFKHGAFGYEVFSGFVTYAGNTNFDFGLFDTDKEHEIIGNVIDNKDLLTKQMEQ